MKFAKFVFSIAGAWGVLVLTPLYFLYDLNNPHPEFFYGFAGVAMAWQLAFFVIATNPVRFRLMMIPAIFEKLSYVLTLVVLYLQKRISLTESLPSIPDGILGLLFAVAFFRVRRQGA